MKQTVKAIFPLFFYFSTCISESNPMVTFKNHLHTKYLFRWPHLFHLCVTFKPKYLYTPVLSTCTILVERLRALDHFFEQCQYSMIFTALLNGVSLLHISVSVHKNTRKHKHLAEQIT